MPADHSAVSFDRSPRRQQLPEEVASYVRELIISGEVKPGEFLRMERIAEAVGVSNTPVREGLLALRSEGFVRQEPRRGFVVAPFSRRDVRDLFWVQSLLAGELAARAASSITPERIAVLERITADYAAAVKQDDKEAIALLGPAFHREINLAAESHRLALVLGSVVRSLSIRFFSTLDGQVEATLKEHPQLIRAMKKRDEGRARSLMAAHVLHGADLLIESLERRGMWSEEG